MECQILFSYNEGDWETILKHVEKLPDSFQIVTSNYMLNEFLRKNWKNSRMLNEIFPEEGQLTYEVHKASKKLLEEYRRCFQTVTYRGYPIFSGIENQLLDQIILYEKAGRILEEKRDTIFIFEDFMFVYFAIMKLASELGYENELTIGYVRGGKIEYLLPTTNTRFIVLRTKFYALKNIFFSKTYGRQRVTMNLVASLLRTKSLTEIVTIAKNIVVTVLKIIFDFVLALLEALLEFTPFFVHLYFYKTFFGKNSEKRLLNRIDNKINSTDAKYNAECAFFLVTNLEDTYLKSVYPVIEKLHQKGVKFQVFVIDLATRLVLTEKTIRFVNLFDEINILARLMKKLPEGATLKEQMKRVATENNLSVIYLNAISDYLFTEICRSASIITVCEYIIKKMKLRSAVIAVDGQMYGNCVVTVCKNYKLPTFFIPSVIINSNPLHKDLYKADKICIYGVQGLEALTSIGYSKERIILTGSPKYDYFKQLDSKTSRKFLQENHNIDINKKLLVVGMARWHKDDEIWMSDLIKFCNRNNIEIVIKVHPTYTSTPTVHEESESKIRSIRERCKNLKYLITYDLNLHILLAGADLVITDYSNVGAEAILLDRPLITANFIKGDLTNEQRYHEYGASIYVENYDKLENLIWEIFELNWHIDELATGRKKIVETYNIYNDGKAAERIVDLLIGSTKLEIRKQHEIL